MSEKNNKVIRVDAEKMEEVIKKAGGLCELLYAAAADAEYGGGLSEDSIIILADIANEIKSSLPCSAPHDEWHDAINDVYENLDVIGRAHLVKYAGELDEERRKAQ